MFITATIIRWMVGLWIICCSVCHIFNLLLYCFCHCFFLFILCPAPLFTCWCHFSLVYNNCCGFESVNYDDFFQPHWQSMAVVPFLSCRKDDYQNSHLDCLSIIGKFTSTQTHPCPWPLKPPYPNIINADVGAFPLIQFECSFFNLCPAE